MKYVLLAFLLVHSEYPILCCGGDGFGGDCHPVPCDSIVETKDGFDWNGFHFAPKQVRPSFNSECHACVSHYSYNSVTRCLFIQPTS